MAIWLTLVYAPICHWVWGGGWLGGLGALDFAGGTVVHINAGVSRPWWQPWCSASARAIPTPRCRRTTWRYTLIGASMLWVGWFGFNAGSELAADGTAGMAMTVTQLATATAALTWMFTEWMNHGKPSVLGIASGAVAGLVAITPASGTVGPWARSSSASPAALFAFLASTKVKRALGL